MDDAKQRKRLQNRHSQRRHRAKQQQLIEDLEQENSVLSSRIRLLENRLTEATFGDREAVVSQKMESVRERIGSLMSDLKELEVFIHGDLLPAPSRTSEQKAVEEVGSVSTSAAADLSIASTTRSTPEILKPFDLAATFTLPRQITLNTLVVTNTIVVDFLSLENDSKTAKVDDLVGNNNHILKNVCSFANEFVKKVPHMGTYSFLFGGTQWLCSEILMIKMAHSGVSDEQVLPLFEGMLLPHDVKGQIRQQLAASKETRAVEEFVQLADGVLSQFLGERQTSLIPQQFWPTPLQKFLLRSGQFPSYNINFIIWPEFRDNLMMMWDQLDPDLLSPLWCDILENVVIEMGEGKIFFVYETALVLKYTCEAQQKGTGYNFTPTLQDLFNHGLFDTQNWKLTRRLGMKYAQVVPINIVIDDVDDSDERCIVRPRRI